MAEPRFYVRSGEGAPEKGPFSFAQIEESHAAKRLKDGAMVRSDDGSSDAKTVRDLLDAKQDERAAMLVSFARQDEAADERRGKKTGNTKIILGLACVFAGGGASAASYASAAESAGRYILLSGLVAFGIVLVVRGLSRR